MQTMLYIYMISAAVMCFAVIALIAKDFVSEIMEKRRKKQEEQENSDAQKAVSEENASEENASEEMTEDVALQENEAEISVEKVNSVHGA